MDWDWNLLETLGKTVGALIGMAVAGYKAYQLGVGGIQSRLALKRDLEVLKMLAPTDPGHALVKAHVDQLIQKLYEPHPPPIRKRLKDLEPKKWGDFATGIFTFLGFSLWTAYLDRHGFSWWSVLTGLFAMSGIYGIFDSYGLMPDSRQRPQTPQQPVSGDPPTAT